MRTPSRIHLLANALSLVGMAISLPASAVLISTEGPISFSGTASITDTNPTAGPNSNANALFGTATNSTTSFQKFDPAIGVLTKTTVSVATTTRTTKITGNRVGTSTGTATGTGSSTPRLVLPTGSTAFTSTGTLNGICGGTGNPACPYTVTGTPTAINSTISITNTATLASYVGASSSFDVVRMANISATSGGTATNSTTTFESTWNGTLKTIYEYLRHANPSFNEGADVNTLTIDFGMVLQGTSVSPIDFNLFNLGGTNTVGLDLDTIESTGNDSTLTVDLASFYDLAGGTGYSFQAFIDTFNPGDFEATYTLGFSDNDVGAEATRYSSDNFGYLTLILKGKVQALQPLGTVPEPATLALLGLGLAGLGMARRRRNND